MTAAGQPPPVGADTPSPASFLAAAAALEAIDHALHDANSQAPDPAGSGAGPEQALASLLLLRQVREQLAGWETGLIETARDAGASWADLAHPLGVASRQAAERRYLRNRPGPAGTTAEQRVQATRERRAADRTHTAWARDNAAALRRLAGQITALTDLPPASRTSLGHLDAALAHDDPAALVSPLAATRPYLTAAHPRLAAQLDTLIGPATQHPDRPSHP
ncbi:type III effector protein [Streptomyces sp. NPDC020719]|uniref:type III effector protein n=1 Tax=unclassified Streptomyces TaxID=2593676 RepID=UPI0033EFA8E7